MSRDLVGFALHALEPAEELAVRGHLRTCRECAHALPGHEAVLAGLGSTVRWSGPPPQLRRRILDSVHAGEVRRPTEPSVLRDPGRDGGRFVGRDGGRDRGRFADPDRGADGVGDRGGDGVGGRSAETETETAPEPRRRSRLPRRLAGALVAAACAVAVGGLAGQAVSTTGPGLDRTVAALETPGSVHSTLHDERGTPVAAVVASAEAVHVVVADLPANDPTRSVYVLWAIGAGAPTPVGTFDAGARGTRVVALPAAETRAVSYAVSLEPGRVAPASPGRVVASGQLA